MEKQEDKQKNTDDGQCDKGLALWASDQWRKKKNDVEWSGSWEGFSKMLKEALNQLK